MFVVLIMKFFILNILFLIVCLNVFSQKSNKSIEAGFGIEYNYQTKGFAPEIRAEIAIYKNASVTPRLSYFPGFNTVHELFLGLDANYHFPIIKKFSFYSLLGIYYDHWINSDEFTSTVAKKSNAVIQAGIGVEYNRGCLNPFLEHRYDFKWKEGTTVLGIKFNFGKCGFGGRGGGWGGNGLCPAYGNRKR